MSEKKLQDSIMQYLSLRKDCLVWRQNTGVAQYGKRWVRFGVPGQADISGVLLGGRRLEIEVKIPGNKQSQDQKNFQARIESMGGLYILAYSIDDIVTALI